jgi:hypothetical protein
MPKREVEPGPTNSDEMNAIVAFFRMLNKQDLKLLGGVTLGHIQFVLGAPRKKRAGRIDADSPLKESLDSQVFREHELNRKVRVEEGDWLGLQKAARHHALKVAWLCHKNHPRDKECIRHLQIYVLLFEMATELERAKIWTERNRRDFAKKANVSQIVQRHCSTLERLKILRSDDAGEREKKRKTNIIERARRLDVRYYPGRRLRSDPNRLEKLKRRVLKVRPSDIRLGDGVFLLGVSQIPRSLRSSLPSQMIADLNQCARRLRGTWLKEHMNEVMKTSLQVREREAKWLNQLLPHAEEDRKALHRKVQEHYESLDSAGRTELIVQTERELRGILDECQELTRVGSKEIEKATPKLPLVIIDFNALPWDASDSS